MTREHYYRPDWQYTPGRVVLRGEIVDAILVTKSQNPAVNVSALEAEINLRVYALYGLTEDEIALVESRA